MSSEVAASAEDNYLAGLRVKKDATDTEITYTGGKVMFPEQSGYRAGKYVEHEGVFEISITDNYGRYDDLSATFRILTDADGSYSYTQYLPAEQVSKQSSEAMVTASVNKLDNGATSPTTDSFNHYSNIDGSTFTLAGTYASNEAIYFDSSKKQVAAAAAGSTYLPDFYYKFTPDLSSLTDEEKAIVDWYGKESNYYSSISGWEIPVVDAYTNNLTINLDIYNQAVSFTANTAAATWTKFTGENVTVSMTLPSGQKTYYTTTNSGTIALSMPIAETAGDASVTGLSVKVEDTAEHGFVAYDKLSTDPQGVAPVMTYVDGTWSADATLSVDTFTYNTSNATVSVTYTGNDSAKVAFTPTVEPTWWSIYDWSTVNIQ